MSDFHSELRAFSAAIEDELRGGELVFPTVLDLSLRIRRVAEDPNSSIEQMAALVRIEPVVSARVLRLANSVVFNMSGKNTTNVTEAIQRIGMSNVRVTALVVAMDQLAQEHRSKAMRGLAKDVWRYSIDVAAWAYAISRRLRIGQPDTAMLAGMMIDVGQLFLIARVGRYPAVAADLAGFAEMAEFWSGALTRAVLESMGLPGDILDALDFSEPYRGSWPPVGLDEVLYVAVLAAESEHPFQGNRSDLRRVRLERAKHELDPHRLGDLLSDAEAERNALLAALEG